MKLPRRDIHPIGRRGLTGHEHDFDEIAGRRIGQTDLSFGVAAPAKQTPRRRNGAVVFFAGGNGFPNQTIVGFSGRDDFRERLLGHRRAQTQLTGRIATRAKDFSGGCQDARMLSTQRRLLNGRRQSDFGECRARDIVAQSQLPALVVARAMQFTGHVDGTCGFAITHHVFPRRIRADDLGRHGETRRAVAQKSKDPRAERDDFTFHRNGRRMDRTRSEIFNCRAGKNFERRKNPSRRRRAHLRAVVSAPAIQGVLGVERADMKAVDSNAFPHLARADFQGSRAGCRERSRSELSFIAATPAKHASVFFDPAGGKTNGRRGPIHIRTTHGRLHEIGRHDKRSAGLGYLQAAILPPTIKATVVFRGTRRVATGEYIGPVGVRRHRGRINADFGRRQLRIGRSEPKLPGGIAPETRKRTVIFNGARMAVARGYAREFALQTGVHRERLRSRVAEPQLPETI